MSTFVCFKKLAQYELSLNCPTGKPKEIWQIDSGVETSPELKKERHLKNCTVKTVALSWSEYDKVEIETYESNDKAVKISWLCQVKYSRKDNGLGLFLFDYTSCYLFLGQEILF
jgi:hypothetical protein